MEYTKHILWSPEEYAYPLAAGFTPFLTSYIHPEGAARPAMLVVPGGGYCFVAPSEGGPVATEFYNAGYNAFVLTYTVNPMSTHPLGLQPLRDISRAVRFIRKNSESFSIDKDRLAICGFSAGGHLCASLCVHYNDIADPDPATGSFSNRPDAAILSYPVIASPYSAGKLAHEGSFIALLGADASADQLDYMSLEKHVTPDTPPCFLWQTAEDDCVPVENSYLFAQACKAAGVPFAHHVFTSGQHGLALADDAWLRDDYGPRYTLEPLEKLREKARAKEVAGVSPDAMEGWFAPPSEPDPAAKAKQERDCSIVRVWPKLAEAWLESVL